VAKSACGVFEVGLRVLELDVGNSSIKWRLLDDGQRISRGRIAGSLEGVFHLFDQQLSNVRIASVASPARDAALGRALENSALSFQFATSMRSCGGVTNSYGNVSKMGVDRWLAMVAAYSQCQGACVVIDAGSALTIDVIGSDGLHLGGYILPGSKMMVRALGEQTDRVRFGPEEGMGLDPGQDTGSCVHNGKWLALLGAIYASLNLANQASGKSCDVYITGGDAPVLVKLAGSAAAGWHYCEDLVLDGLVPVLASV
jgi:type III pantothenate kinase